jgi:hypothetical protein
MIRNLGTVARVVDEWSGNAKRRVSDAAFGTRIELSIGS